MKRILSSLGFVVALAVSAQAGSILSPTAVINNTAGDFSAAAAIDSVIDQSGLTAGFVSGVTDFDTYLAGAPTHSWIFTDGAEWFSLGGVRSGIVDFDLGAVHDIRRFALWNEEFSGLLSVDVTTSNDPLFGVGALVASVAPVDTPFDGNYGAEVFNLTSSTARYVRFEMTGPQIPNRGIFLSMGEVAFDVQPIPEPSSIILLGLGVVGLGVMRRRRKSA